VDPQYLAWKLRSLNFTARFVELADAINGMMPDHVVAVVTDALNDRGLAVRGARLLVLGVTYKRDVGDVRESPALAIVSTLLGKGAEVSFHDPFVERLELPEGSPPRVEPTDALLQEADAVLILTDHSAYDARRVARLAKLVVDTRNATARAVAEDSSLRSKIHRI
jgi:UDP-N-acetyl-D-glucosamine dehydrogenase